MADTSADPTFFAGHAAAIHVRVAGKKSIVGTFGILHPTVLENFELRYVCLPTLRNDILSLLERVQVPSEHP